MIRKVFIILLVMVGILLGALFIAMSIFNSPTYAWRILRYGESDISDVSIFPERTIENGESYSIIKRGDEETPYEVEYLYK